MNSNAIKQEEVVAILPTKSIPCGNENDSLGQRQDDETRGDLGATAVKREEDASEQREPAIPSKKKQSSPGQTGRSSKSDVPSLNNNKNNNNNNSSSGAQLQPPQQHQQPQQQRFNNPQLHPNMGPGPGRGPFPMGRGYGAPPPYGYPGGPGNYPPPPHFHHPHAPHPHPHMMGPGGPYQGGPGPYGGMKGNFPPMGPYGGPPGPYGMPQYPPQHGSMGPGGFGNNSMNNNMGPGSSNDSISSKSSMTSKKKRTIDGMHGNNNNKMPMSNTYPFRRTDSTTSTTSTVTCGNNTSTETHGDDSNRSSNHHDDPKVASLNMDSMMFGGDHRSNNGQTKASLHRREFSGASTASTLSVGGFSLASYERGNNAATDAMMIDNPLTKNSPKRHKKNTLVVDTEMQPPSLMTAHSMEGPESSRFEQLSIEAKNLPSTDSSSTAGHSNLFLSLSTSPINADVDATPNIKNTSKPETKRDSNQDSIFKAKGGDKHRPSDTPTPPVHGELGDSESLHDDHSTLNRHLRGQSFTPLPHLSHVGSSGASPSNGAFAGGIAPQLSWSIAGDTPSLGDLADWDDEHGGKFKLESTKNRPSSTTSTDTRNMTISPHDFQLWKEEHDLADRAVSGTTTPLPVFFEQSGNELTENQNRFDSNNNNSNNNNHSKQHGMRHNDPMAQHPMHMGNNGGRGKHDHPFWKHDGGMGMPPTPMFAGSEFRDDGFTGHSPMPGDRREGMDFPYPPYPHPHNPNDRIRNLRGRVPPGAHLPPMPLHIPPHMSAHHLPLTSPMGLGPKGGMWSPHHGMGGHLGSPHHMGSPLNSMAQSKRKCLPLKPPIPSKFQGDMEKVKSAPVPEFTSLVNFPAHMSQKQAVNLPEGMRCCVMCGQACPCSTGNKGGKKSGKPGCKNDGGLAPRSNNGQDHLGDKNSGYAIIPTQNKGLCTLCDVNVWVVANSGLEIKWCKGCKNFRPWAAFGDKGLATKCLRCRERQREKYALQKEEKEKARMVAKAKK